MRFRAKGAHFDVAFINVLMTTSGPILDVVRTQKFIGYRKRSLVEKISNCLTVDS